MPRKNKAQQRPVFVAVYVERPRRRRLQSSAAVNNHHHHHHHHHNHLHLHQVNNIHGGGSNRRAELLNYSRRLRESAPPSTHHHHQNKSLSTYIQQPINQMVGAQSKAKHSRDTPACMGIWKVIIPRFLRSLRMSQGNKQKRKKRSSSGTSNVSAATKATAIMHSFQVQKKKGFLKKFFATIQKYR